jgi:hexosaminidase
MLDTYLMMPWRGAMLDISRHYFDKDFIKKTMSALALFDYNVLQLHLTDDQGWRFESKKFPLLHEVGSRRLKSQINHSLQTPEFEYQVHEGFLSQADIKEIVDHGKSLNIDVVPEINIPGHTGALLAAYPQFGVNGEIVEVSGQWGISNHLLRPFPETFEFLRELFREVSSVFPSEYIHVGGDESLIDNWLKDSEIVSFMEEQGFDTPKELFIYFMKEIEVIISSLDKKMITWDDAFAFDPSQATQATVMSWRGAEISKTAMQHGRDVIFSPVFPTYFDYSQELSESEPLAIGGPVTLEDVLAFKPIDGVLGVQCQMWTEYIEDPTHLEYMMWPRAAALAFAAWGDGGDFMQYFNERRAGLDLLGITIREIEPLKRKNIADLGVGKYFPGFPVASMMQKLEESAASGEIAH